MASGARRGVPLMAAYAATLLAMIVVDSIWIGAIVQPMYQREVGHLLAPQPNLAAAALFYVIYPLGLMIFAVAPGALAAGWRPALARGAAFGFFAYATFDLTNLATLKDWPLGLSLMDIAWGCVVSAVAAGAGKVVMDRFARTAAS
jgi:uncharacterized membrane protein